MSYFYFSVYIGEGRLLCLAPLTERRIAMADQELSDTSGYFLFETSSGELSTETEIIARVVSEEAALRLRKILNMS